jgi:hypothetical protein
MFDLSGPTSTAAWQPLVSDNIYRQCRWFEKMRDGTTSGSSHLLLPIYLIARGCDGPVRALIVEVQVLRGVQSPQSRNDGSHD